MTVSKRVNLTIPDSIYLDLEDWANQQGRPLANLASFLCETAVIEAKEKGTYKPSPARQRESEAATTKDTQDSKTQSID